MRFPFKERKAAQAAAYILAKHHDRLNYMKLIKLLYLADRESLIDRGKPITGARMVSMPYGPVLSEILNLINLGRRYEEPSPWFEYISSPDGYDVCRVVNADAEYDELSDHERQILETVDTTFGRMNKWSLVDWTHELPEWHDPQGSSLPIDPAEILRAEGRSERDIQRIARNAMQAMLFEKLGRIDIELETD
jgi:uncharacterized phage-associated protein